MKKCNLWALQVFVPRLDLWVLVWWLVLGAVVGSFGAVLGGRCYSCCKGSACYHTWSFWCSFGCCKRGVWCNCWSCFGYGLTPSTQTCAKVASVLERRAVTMNVKMKLQFWCAADVLWIEENMLSGVYTGVIFSPFHFALDSKVFDLQAMATMPAFYPQFWIVFSRTRRCHVL